MKALFTFIRYSYFVVAMSMSTSIFAKDKGNPPPPIFIAPPYPQSESAKDVSTTATIAVTVNTNGVVDQTILLREREIVRYVSVTNIVYQPSAPVWSSPAVTQPPPQYAVQPSAQSQQYAPQPVYAQSQIPYPTIVYPESSQACYGNNYGYNRSYSSYGYYGGRNYEVDLGFRWGSGGHHNRGYYPQQHYQHYQHHQPSYPAHGVGWNVVYHRH